jgi:hypothetical protein
MVAVCAPVRRARAHGSNLVNFVNELAADAVFEGLRVEQIEQDGDIINAEPQVRACPRRLGLAGVSRAARPRTHRGRRRQPC